MKVVEVNVGKKIEYSVSKNKITKCPCGRACGYAVQKHAFRAVGRGRADGGGCPCVSVSG